ncbi:MAG: PQQ-binding-like beta-propeller repeat protein, partial [Planctomycetota bacterium]|nr:PQQ-binding-like beta-propeller repeat protein [Planctomycetota bacterium]
SYKFVADINADGVQDMLVGIPGDSSSGMVENGSIRALSGADGIQQWQIHGTTNFGQLGTSFLGLGDVDGDGIEDFATGLDTAGTQGRVDNGYLEAHSSVSGALLWRFDGATSGEQMGKVTKLIADISGDGLEDIVVSSHLADIAGFGDNGKITAIASNDGHQLWSVHGDENQEMLGKDMKDASDIDGDGVDDLLVFSSRADTHGLRDNGMVKALSATDGSTIWRHDGGHDGDRAGEARVLSYDHDYDGTSDLILGSGFATSTGLLNNGAVVALSAGKALRLSVDSFRSGGWATLSLRGMLAGNRAHFFGTLYGPGDTVMAPGLTLGLYQPVVFLGGAYADSTGHAQFSKRVPPGYAGRVAWLQGVQDSLGTYSTSNMVQATFQ